MAYTKSPTQDSHNVVRIPADTGPIMSSSTTSYPDSSLMVNCFSMKEKQWGSEPIMAIHKREGFQSAIAANSITATGMFGQNSVQSYGGLGIFFARGGQAYIFNYFTTALVNWSSAATVVAGGWHCNFIDSTNARRVGIINSAGTILSCLEDGTGGASYGINAAIGDTINNIAGLVFIDGYLFAVNANGNKIYNSSPGGVWNTWAATDFLDAEQYADAIRFIAKHKNYLVAFGQSSTEFFYDGAIEVGSPLARQETYSERVGIVIPAIPNRVLPPLANIEDDLYFVGTSETGSRGLYSVRNFRITRHDSPYIQGLLNNGSLEYAGIVTQVINNNPNIIIEFETSSTATKRCYAYLPSEDVWWRVNGGEYISYHERLGFPITPINPVYGTDTVDSITLFAPGSSSGLYYSVPDPDGSSGPQVLATFNTPVIDFGTNRYKHICRVDAIGDYGANALTLTYKPNQYYETTGVSCGSQTSSTIGLGNNISWYNLGGYRRFILTFAMNGAVPAIHRGFDIEYTVGVA